MKCKGGPIVLAALLGGLALGALVDQAMRIYLKIGDMEDPVKVVSDPDDTVPEEAQEEAEAVQEEAPAEDQKDASAEDIDDGEEME